MSIKNLLEKSDDNFKTGNWAETNEFYDTAISRYYYSLYEKIIYISKKNGFYTDPPRDKDSHVYTIKEFKKNVSITLQPQELAKLVAISKLKTLRVDADYKEKRVQNLNEFNLSFKFFFNSINEVLDKLI